MIHTCPRCELRFATEAELTEHLHVDHHVDASEFERFTYKTPVKPRPTKRYIVVANRTLSDDSLIERIAELGNDGHVHLVAPATPSRPGADLDDKALALATYRMRRAVDRLHEMGVDADGEVGNADPVHAVATTIDHEPADEIVVATLPEGASQWLHVDLPKALEHRFGLPVRVWTATG